MKNPESYDDVIETPATFTVKPAIVEGCECEDCQAGRHLYSLYRWTETGWR